jgi:hypothetical protein
MDHWIQKLAGSEFICNPGLPLNRPAKPDPKPAISASS